MNEHTEKKPSKQKTIPSVTVSTASPDSFVSYRKRKAKAKPLEAHSLVESLSAFCFLLYLSF